MVLCEPGPRVRRVRIHGCIVCGCYGEWTGGGFGVYGSKLMRYRSWCSCSDRRELRCWNSELFFQKHIEKVHIKRACGLDRAAYQEAKQQENLSRPSYHHPLIPRPSKIPNKNHQNRTIRRTSSKKLMPLGLGQQTHRRGEQQRKHNQHTDRIQRLVLGHGAIGMRRSGRELVHGDDGDNEQDEDDGRDEDADQCVDARAAVEGYVFVVCFGAELGGAEEGLERGRGGAEYPLRMLVSDRLLTFSIRTYLERFVELT